MVNGKLEIWKVESELDWIGPREMRNGIQMRILVTEVSPSGCPDIIIRWAYKTDLCDNPACFGNSDTPYYSLLEFTINIKQFTLENLTSTEMNVRGKVT